VTRQIGIFKMEAKAFTAFPPPAGFTLERGRSNSNASAARLRATSDMYVQGLISGDEKTQIKKLLLQSDPQFKEKFDTARMKASQSGDTRSIRSLLRDRPAVSNVDIADMMTLEDFGFFIDSSPYEESPGLVYPPVQDSYRQSIGFAAEFTGVANVSVQDNYRKRDGSRSLPTQGMRKVSGNAPSDRRVSRPADVQTMYTPTISQPVHSPVSGMPSQGFYAYTQPEDDKNGTLTKVKKNERERKRRLAVTQGFEALNNILQELDQKDIKHDRGPQQKLDKASILRSSIDKISYLENEIERLRSENEMLKAGSQQ